MTSKLLRVLLKGVAIVGGVFVLLIALYACMYYWSPIYGGKYYQRKAFSAEGKILLSNYNKEQGYYFSKNKKFDRTLHTSKELYEDRTNFKLGFNDVPVVARYCPDCTISDSSYKIAAYAKYESEDVIWTIDDKRELVPIKQ